MSNYLGGEIPLIVLGIIILTPTAIWLRYRIEFLKYPKFVKWEYFLRKRKMKWLIIFEQFLTWGLVIGALFLVGMLIFM